MTNSFYMISVLRLYSETLISFSGNSVWGINSEQLRITKSKIRFYQAENVILGSSSSEFSLNLLFGTGCCCSSTLTVHWFICVSVCRSACCVPCWWTYFLWWASSMRVGEIVRAPRRAGGGGERHQAALLQTLHTEAVSETGAFDLS